MAWRGGELAEDQQDAATPSAPRCLKDVVEETLFARRRDLFSTLDLVFMDTTSLSFEGAGGQRLGRRGFSKDHRPDLNQMILAVLLDGDGRPVCTEMWPGNTADAGCLIPVGRSAAQALFCSQGLPGRRSRHDQRRDDR
jgi:transposase